MGPPDRLDLLELLYPLSMVAPPHGYARPEGGHLWLPSTLYAYSYMLCKSIICFIIIIIIVMQYIYMHMYLYVRLYMHIVPQTVCESCGSTFPYGVTKQQNDPSKADQPRG